MADALTPPTPTLRPPGWTASEALACAYCWSEFSRPEDRDDTPEAYWLSITERARNECRSTANKLFLVSVAKGHAVALLPPNAIEGDFERIKAALGMKVDHRVNKILNTIYLTLRSARK